MWAGKLKKGTAAEGLRISTERRTAHANQQHRGIRLVGAESYAEFPLQSLPLLLSVSVISIRRTSPHADAFIRRRDDFSCNDFVKNVGFSLE